MIFFSLWLVNNVDLLPEAASLNAPIYDELFNVLLVIGLVLFVGMFGLIVYSLINFRKREGQIGDGLAIEGNISLEIFWTIVPAVIVLFIGLYSYDIFDRMGGMQTPMHDHSMQANEKIWAGISPVINNEAKSSSPLPVEVTAMQFAFLFNYPDGNITSGELHVPVNRQISMRMQSNDVITIIDYT